METIYTPKQKFDYKSYNKYTLNLLEYGYKSTIASLLSFCLAEDDSIIPDTISIPEALAFFENNPSYKTEVMKNPDFVKQFPTIQDLEIYLTNAKIFSELPSIDGDSQSL